MKPVLFEIGNLGFYTHGVFAVFGIAASLVCARLLAPKRISSELLIDNVIYSVLIGIIGARITFFLLYKDQFANFKDIFYLWRGGLASYGGFISGALALYLILKRQKEKISAWFDLLSVSFPLGLAVGRIGEAISGEDFGVASKSAWGIRGRIPINLIEALWLIIIFVCLLILRRRKFKTGDGTLTAAMALLYGGGRLIIDFWRGEEKIFLFLSPGQLTGLVLFFGGLAVIFKSRLRRKGQNATG